MTEREPIGFSHPKTGERFLLIGSHTSTVRVGEEPFRKTGCAGCGDHLK